jgi:hypothetical protein
MEYTFKTKQMIKVGEQVGKIYELEKAYYDGDLEILAKLISIFGDVEIDKAFEYIDEQLEANKKVTDLYKEVLDGVNKKGFFNRKIAYNLEAPPINTEQLIKEMYKAEIDKNIKTMQNT